MASVETCRRKMKMECIWLQAKSLNSHLFEQADKTEDGEALLKGSAVLLLGDSIGPRTSVSGSRSFGVSVLASPLWAPLATLYLALFSEIAYNLFHLIGVLKELNQRTLAGISPCPRQTTQVTEHIFHPPPVWQGMLHSIYLWLLAIASWLGMVPQWHNANFTPLQMPLDLEISIAVFLKVQEHKSP